MKKPNKILHKLLCPGTGVVLLSVPVAAGLLVYTFLAAGEDNPIAYLAYVVSAYSLTVVCVNGLPLLKKVIAWGKNIPYVRRYREDRPFRLRLSLYFSLVINLLYAGVNAVSGLFYHSPWFGSLGAYYTILSAMRCLLVRYARKNGFGEDKQAEWKRYRLCGVMLTAMNIALAGVVVLVLRQNELSIRRVFNLRNGGLHLLHYGNGCCQCVSVSKVPQLGDVRSPGHQFDGGFGFHAVAGNGNAVPVRRGRRIPPNHAGRYRRDGIRLCGGNGDFHDRPLHHPAEKGSRFRQIRAALGRQSALDRWIFCK